MTTNLIIRVSAAKWQQLLIMNTQMHGIEGLKLGENGAEEQPVGMQAVNPITVIYTHNLQN